MSGSHPGLLPLPECEEDFELQELLERGSRGAGQDKWSPGCRKDIACCTAHFEAKRMLFDIAFGADWQPFIRTFPDASLSLAKSPDDVFRCRHLQHIRI